jgi:hypothetical protein
MATQFYKSLEEWQQIKADQRQMAQQRMSEYENDCLTNIDDMKRLAGINDNSVGSSGQSVDHSTRMRFIQENNIKPGTPRWFRVMYARPELTGEDPFGE